jgi:hypothetical protein
MLRYFLQYTLGFKYIFNMQNIILKYNLLMFHHLKDPYIFQYIL